MSNIPNSPQVEINPAPPETIKLRISFRVLKFITIERDVPREEIAAAPDKSLFLIERFKGDLEDLDAEEVTADFSVFEYTRVKPKGETIKVRMKFQTRGMFSGASFAKTIEADVDRADYEAAQDKRVFLKSLFRDASHSEGIEADRVMEPAAFELEGFGLLEPGDTIPKPAKDATPKPAKQ